MDDLVRVLLLPVELVQLAASYAGAWRRSRHPDERRIAREILDARWRLGEIDRATYDAERLRLRG